MINAFQNLTDPANPGADVVLKIMKKEELRNVDGSDSLHPNRSGDVVVVLKPPYQFDAATFGQTIAFSQFFGQHGYLPETVDLASGVNMHATFVAAGPGIRKQGPVAGVRAIDLAPTIASCSGSPARSMPAARSSTTSSRARPLEGGDAPLHQRLPRPADPAVADGGHARTHPSPSVEQPISSRGSTCTAPRPWAASRAATTSP